MADLRLSIRAENLDRVRAELAKLSGPQARQAYANALNDAGAKARREMQAAMRQRFDRVTPWIEKSPKVFMATAQTLTVGIAPTTDTRSNWEPGMKLGGKVGVDPQQVLQAQEFGGKRRDKRSEVALARAGILRDGWQTAIPAKPYPGSDDGRGNLRGAFVAQLISYFQAQGEQGYRSNMGKKRMGNLRNQQGIGYMATRKVFKTTLGVRYFVSHGRWRGQHLAPGIWATSGLHDADVRPVVMFVKAGTYKPRLDLQAIARSADLQDYLDRRIRARVRNLAEGKPA